MTFFRKDEITCAILKAAMDPVIPMRMFLEGDIINQPHIFYKTRAEAAAVVFFQIIDADIVRGEELVQPFQIRFLFERTGKPARLSIPSEESLLFLELSASPLASRT